MERAGGYSPGMNRRQPALAAAAALALSCTSVACGPDGGARGWDPADIGVVVASEDPGVTRAAQDLARLLGAATGRTPPVVTDAGDTGRGKLLLVGDGPWECPALIEEAYQVSRTTFDGRMSLRFCGDATGAQYAVYEWLHQIGVRYVHPEQTFVPRLKRIPAALTEGAPAYELRGFHLHTQHPLELLEAVHEDDAAEVERAYRYVDWLVANRQNVLQWILLDSIPEPEWKAQAARITAYAHSRGVRVFAQTSFTSEQQNAHRLVDPGDEIDDLQQIREGIDSILEAGFDAVVFSLGSSEFSETDPDETIAWMNEAAAHALAEHDVPVYMVNHVPAGLFVPEYGVNFFDLPAFADPEVGTFVHTTMFYGLRGPAPVYGNVDFSRQRDFLEDEVGERPIVYFPESAWWLTFDNAMPLFLPIYVERRIDDLNYLATVPGVEGHVTFSSGWEWGYWLTDLAIARGSWEPERTFEPALEELLAPFGDGAVSRVTALALEQRDALLEDALTPFLTGEDVPTEIGYAAGIVFHPLIPTPSSVLAMTADALDDYSESLDDLGAHCTELRANADAWREEVGDGLTPHPVMFPLEGTAPRPARVIDAAPVLEEFRDATEITALRCENALAGQRALVAARRIALRLEPAGDPVALLAEARAATARAQQVVVVREAGYRYEPDRVSSDSNENATDYDHRVHGRTHRLFFWHYRDDAIQLALDGASRGLSIAPVQFLAGSTVAVDPSLAGFDEGEMLDIDWGDGTTESFVVGTGLVATHVYSTAGQPTMSLEAVASGSPVTLDVKLSSAIAIYSIPRTSVTLTVPASDLAEDAIVAFIPDLEIGVNSTSGAFVASLARDRDGDGSADTGTVDHLPPGTRTGDDVAIAGMEMELPVESATGRIGTLRIRDADLTWSFTQADATLSNGVLAGEVLVSELVAVITATGVVEEEGALNILAAIFEFDPAAPPERVAVELALSGSRTAP